MHLRNDLRSIINHTMLTLIIGNIGMSVHLLIYIYINTHTHTHPHVSCKLSFMGTEFYGRNAKL